MRTEPPLRTSLRTFVSTNAPPLPPDVLFIARGAQSGAKRAIFRLLGLQPHQKQVEEDTSNVCSRSPVLRGLPARKEQQKEKARTSFSKGERQRESKGKDKHSKEINSPTLRTSRGGSRKANQIASEKQIASSKQSTKYVDGRTKNEAARHHRSTTAKQSTYSTTPKQSTTS